MKSHLKNPAFHFVLVSLLAMTCSLWAGENLSRQEAALGARLETQSGINCLITPGGIVFHRTTRDVADLRTRFVPGGDTQIYLWDEEMPSGRSQAFHAVSGDGKSIDGRVRATTYDVRLSDHSFDPLAHIPVVSFTLSARPTNSLFLVQFVSTPLPEFRFDIESLGGQIHRFMTDHTFIVEISTESLKQVAALPYVRWTGPYHPEYRVENFLRQALVGGAAKLDEQRYSIMVCSRDHDRQIDVANLVQNLGGFVHFTTPGGCRMEATLTHDQLLEVVHANAVQYIDRWGGPGEMDMNIVRAVGGADYLEGLTGWSGQGVRGEIFDTELRTTHQEWPTSPIIHSSATSGSYHGTSCYSINFAQGVDSAARGLVPSGQGIFFLYSESSQFGGSKSRYDVNQELIDPAGPYRAVFQTSSVGSSRTTLYTTLSAETDDYLFQYPVLSTQSQSNAGDQMSRPQAWSKNIVSVGGVYHYGTADRSDDRWNYGASIGPAEDGRIKPDVAYFYDGIRSAYGSGDTTYTEFGGTSAATPETAGHFGLFFQMWHEQVWAGHGGDASVFDSRPQMATAKAMIINHAYRYDWTGGGANGDINRNVQGWGTADLRNLYDRAPFAMIVDETDLIAPLETRTYNVNVAAGEEEFNVTMVYTDPMGTPGAAHHRINDLSLKVTAPSSTVYWGNNGLQSGNTSTSGGNSNTIDTVENVFIQNPEAGTWTVQVIGDEIVEDSHVETPGLDADFALVISGISAGNLAPSTPSNPNPADGASGVDLNADLNWNGGDPNAADMVYYDVYFGTDPAPALVERIGPYPATQTSLAYDPGLLAYNTQYYWKIVAEDDQASSTEGPVWSFTSLEPNLPPSQPGNPDPADSTVGVNTNADLAWDGGDPNSDDTVYYEIHFGETSPPPLFDTTATYPASTTRIGYDPGALSANTQYFWQIVAWDNHGASTSGSIWSFTTQDAQPEDFYATQDIAVTNSGITGNYTDTFASDNGYEAIAEQISNRSILEHKWTLNVTGGLSSYVFYLEAHHTANTEGDDFVFAFSTDNVNFTDMVTVTKTSDDGSYQTFALPTSLSGTVYVRVLDTDRSKWNKSRDMISIDHMYIQGTGTPPQNYPPYVASNPDPTDGASGIDLFADLGWNGGDPNSIDTVYYEVYLGETSPPAYFATTPSYPAAQTSISYDPGALSANTQYFWQIVAYDNRGESTQGPIWSYSTGSAPLVFFAGMDISVSNSGISGSYLDTHASDDVYEGITERATNRSLLEHKWTIDVVGGHSAYTFSVEAYHTFNTEGDDFVFAYSTDDVNYMNIVTVTKTSDDDTAQTFSLPASISGTIYIKVLDLDRTKGNRIKDSIYVDRMFIEATP